MVGPARVAAPLEREPALAALDAALAGAAAGEGRVALVYGEAGIGKTSLVDHFTRTRARSARLLWGACDSLYTPRPLGPACDIAPHAGAGLSRALDAGAAPRAMFSAVLDELGRRPPVVAVLEDLRWADAGTLDLVKFAGRRIHRVPALLVLTYRDDELGPRHPLRVVLGDLATSPGLRNASPSLLARSTPSARHSSAAAAASATSVASGARSPDETRHPHLSRATTRVSACARRLVRVAGPGR